MEDRIPAANMLIELISRIAALQKLGRGTAENARYLEEEARLALAAGANPPAPEKLIEKEQKIEQELDELVEGFSRAGFKLSMLLPAIFKAYRKAAAATGPLKESIRKAGQELSAGSTKAAVDSLGETNLQLGVFLTDLDRVRDLLDDLEGKQEIAQLLDSARAGDATRIFIGAENKLFALSGSSVIAKPFRGSDGRVVGVVGVIGPTRLNYARVGPMVEFTAATLARLMG